MTNIAYAKSYMKTKEPVFIIDRKDMTMHTATILQVNEADGYVKLRDETETARQPKGNPPHIVICRLESVFG